MSTIPLAALSPVLLVQAILVRRRTPRLPGAAGPASGTVPGPGRALRLLVLGESTAAGVGAATHDTALTGQLAAALGCAVDWRVAGRIGATAATVTTRLVPHLAPADLVVLVLGVNDTTRLRSARRWTADLLRLIIAVRRRLGPVPIVITGAPPMDAFPALPRPLRTLLGRRSRELNAATARLAATVSAVTLAPTPRAVLTPDTFCQDGFHPSEAGYRRWAHHLAPTVHDAVAPLPA